MIGCFCKPKEAIKKKSEVHFVPRLSAPIRLQEYGVGIFESAVTKSALKKALKKGLISVDDQVATSATFITGGEKIELIIPEQVPSKRKFDLSLKVLFEDEYLAVIHKPAGVVVSGNEFKTIARALPENLWKSTLSDSTTAQPVHRLDYGTTGVLLVGKTSSSIRALNKMFEKKKVEKMYYAIAIGEMDKTGQINAKIDNKPSQSDYMVRASVPSKRFGSLTLIQLTPRTGRRHQLRKHLSGIGHPILGDKDYGLEHLILKGKGLYLHAYSLRFIHPFSNREVHVIAELPLKFRKIFPDSDSTIL